ncbi:hypothetical protein [Alkalithermobacter paradoxus]|uniref:Uncharacterized protein n=1 Tax=Alkalithermobacter paradoxus TaxID=29349 RepID=A0A1V4I4Z9_9FIRM|nr:hypothetical protein CLOTH_17160 [[Clostridium] thermoalcaliphilum]
MHGKSPAYIAKAPNYKNKTVLSNKAYYNWYYRYGKYISYDMKESILVFNKTTPEHIVDDEHCNIIYEIYFKNISDKKIKLHYRLYIPEELTKNIIRSGD